MMKALQLKAPNDLVLCEVPVPQPGRFEIVSRVEAVSICGTDPHIIAGEYPGYWPKDFPLVPGHEWAGVVAMLGEGAEDLGWQIGDRVCGISHCGCGYCAMCLEGRYNLCQNYGKSHLGHRQYGHNMPGAYAQYINTSIKSVAKIPPTMQFDVACCMDPLSIALHAVMRSGLQPGDSVLVNGAGAQGLYAILCAKSMGAGTVLVSGSGHRLEVAEGLGAKPIDYRREMVARRARDLTQGRGPKCVIECSGTQEGFRNACEAVAAGGCISVISLPSGDADIPLRSLVLQEVSIVGNRANPNTLERALSIAQNNMKAMESLVTHHIPLAEYQKAFAIFNDRLENSIRVVIHPNENHTGENVL